MLDAVAIDRIEETTEHGLVTVGAMLNDQQRREMVRRSFVAEVAGVLRIPEPTQRPSGKSFAVGCFNRSARSVGVTSRLTRTQHSGRIC